VINEQTKASSPTSAPCLQATAAVDVLDGADLRLRQVSPESTDPTRSGVLLLRLTGHREEVPMNNEAGRNPITTLIYEIGQAARAGWAQTARLIALLTVAAVAVALVVATSR
jgi:hypothetical protein